MIEQLQKDDDIIRQRMASYRRETLFENLPVLGEIAAVDVSQVSLALKELDTTISPQDKMATCQSAYNACTSAIDDLMKMKRRSTPFEITTDHVTSVFVLALPGAKLAHILAHLVYVNLYMQTAATQGRFTYDQQAYAVATLRGAVEFYNNAPSRQQYGQFHDDWK